MPPRIKQFLQFLCVSLGAGAIEAGTFSLLEILLPQRDLFIVIAEVVSVALSCLFNFTVNRKYTFKSYSNYARGVLLYGLFYLVMTPLGAQFILFMVHRGIDPLIAKPVKMVVNFLFDYLFCRFVLFRELQKAQAGKRRRTGDVGM